MGQRTFSVTVEGEEPNIQWTDFVAVVPDIVIAPGSSQWVDIGGFVNNSDPGTPLVVHLDSIEVENVGDTTAEVEVTQQGFSHPNFSATNELTTLPGDNVKITFSLRNAQAIGEDPETVSVTVNYHVEYEGQSVNPDGTPA